MLTMGLRMPYTYNAYHGVEYDIDHAYHGVEDDIDHAYHGVEYDIDHAYHGVEYDIDDRIVEDGLLSEHEREHSVHCRNILEHKRACKCVCGMVW